MSDTIKFLQDVHMTGTLNLSGGSFLQNVSNASTSPIPTSAELTSAFGAPSGVGNGFTAILNVSGASEDIYQVVTDGAFWWYNDFVKAI